METVKSLSRIYNAGRGAIALGRYFHPAFSDWSESGRPRRSSTPPFVFADQAFPVAIQTVFPARHATDLL